MRVSGGVARGRRLKSPREGATRPTSDLVRGAIFDMLESLGADLSRVLDLYAGTGALGIEALSRGAGWCDFVERDFRSCRLIEENLALTGLRGRAQVHRATAEKAVARLKGAYTLVLADPPYADESTPRVLEGLASSGGLAEEGLVVLEHSRRRAVPEKLGALALKQTRRHGDTCVSIYR